MGPFLHCPHVSRSCQPRELYLRVSCLQQAGVCVVALLGITLEQLLCGSGLGSLWLFPSVTMGLGAGTGPTALPWTGCA